MPRKKNTESQVVDVGVVIDKFLGGLRDDLRKLYDLGKQAGFNDGAVAERKRMTALFQGEAVKITSGPVSTTSPSVPQKSAQPKKKRANPWDKYTPEQKAARLASLAEARAKSAVARKGGTQLVEEPLAASPSQLGVGDDTSTATNAALVQETAQA